MAFVADVKYIYPANLGVPMTTGNQKRVVVRVTGISDGANNAADEIAINKSDLLGLTGSEPNSLVIEEVEWSVNGYDYLLIEWDHTTGGDVEAFRLTGAGFKYYGNYGGLVTPGTDGTGDIVLTTAGGAAGDAFDVTITCRLKG